MGDAVGDLVDLVVRAVVWRLVGEALRDQPQLVLVVVGVLAALWFVGRRVRSRSGSRAGRVTRR